MSGLEIAGAVLGAFPLAISALENYREVAKRLGLFYKIRLEYKKCSDELKCQRLFLRRHLRQLVLPLAVNDNGNQIEALLNDPGGDGWKDPSVAKLLEHRLQDSYELYLGYVEGMKRVMVELNHELSAHSEPVQDRLQQDTKTKGRVNSAVLTKEGRAFQLYKVKFSNGETIRNRLFAELQGYNEKLEKLLDSSDKDAQLVQQASEAKSKVFDTAICNFWLKAARMFHMLAASWNCRCCQQHCANLQLQHRTGKKSEFTFWFEASVPSRWEARKTRISEEDEQASATVRVTEDMASLRLSEPKHRQDQPVKSALRSTPRNKAVGFSKPSPSLMLTPADAATYGIDRGPIASLCASLEDNGESCRGYLADEDCRYFVYTVRQQEKKDIISVTLEQILRGEVRPRPTRRQRYALSLILASSFVQLLETPWLPASLKKGDIVFFQEPHQPGVLLLDQPHVSQDFVGASDKDTEVVSGRGLEFSRSLDQLGIVLLELCFGDILEEQPCRKQWPSGGNEVERAGFDVLAARDWQREVMEEAGRQDAALLSIRRRPRPAQINYEWQAGKPPRSTLSRRYAAWTDEHERTQLLQLSPHLNFLQAPHPLVGSAGTEDNLAIRKRSIAQKRQLRP